MANITLDHAAILKPLPDTKTINNILGGNTADNPMSPLYNFGGLRFPYTPSITGGTTTAYDAHEFIYSNYKINAFRNSYPNDIGITAKFTANSDSEARYMLAMMTFFKTVSKSEFGLNSENAGLPPPTLYFSYLGEYMYNNVPVVVSSYNFTLPNDVNYVNVPGTNDYVPIITTLTATLMHQYNPKSVKRDFNLKDFASGKLINGGFQ